MDYYILFKMVEVIEDGIKYVKEGDGTENGTIKSMLKALNDKVQDVEVLNDKVQEGKVQKGKVQTVKCKTIKSSVKSAKR